ncbi:MAG: YfhO family protein, partial [Candidatus Ventricola sp.]
MNQKMSARPRITCAHAFCLGALLAIIALAPAILPYGGRYVTRGDYMEQQLPFILETRRILRGGLNAYSFNTFLGAPAVGSYSFYTLGSPFVWPLALLPQQLIPFGISVMAVFKHAVAALTSFLFFRKVVRDERLALTGSVLYTFSSFTVINTQFYHFTEVIAFFPLILLGLEIAMSDAPRPGLLALACGLNALVNYYFMLGSALFAALYFAFRFFSEDWKPTRSVRRVVTVVFECGVGCALAGVLLLPSLMHMLTITRTGAGDTPLLAQTYAPAVLLERLRTLLMPIESNVLHAYYGDAPSWSSTACALPVFGLTGAVVFLFAQKKQRWLKALLAALLLASAIPVLCGAFSLFTNTAYTRWWYGLALLLTLATLLALRDVRSRRAWLAAFAACSALVLLLTVPFLLPD